MDMGHGMKKWMVSCLLLTLSIMSQAQNNEIMCNRIRSLQVMAGDNWQDPPVISLEEARRLGNGRTIRISFDDMTHEYHRYVYRIIHCDADWKESSSLFASDYIEGFNDAVTIEDDITESVNTNTLYTHYGFQITNERCALKMSGNYRVMVFDENDENSPIFSACFMVVDPRMATIMRMTTNTDVDVNDRHQQVEMNLNYGNVNVTDWHSQIKTVVLQNLRYDNAVVNAEPAYITSKGLTWSHNRKLIFDGGNEYRKFEMLDESTVGLGISEMDWNKEHYHAYLWPAEMRLSYVYEESGNGAFLLRNRDNKEAEYTSEYVWVHFTLPSDRLPGDVYVNGRWTNDRFLPQYRMAYDETKHRYETTIPLKLGYYSYQYIQVLGDGRTALIPTEGNFYQTRNRYTFLVYYRPIGARTDYLMGYADLK